VDENVGVRLCPLCARGRDYTVKVLEVWPAELAAWLRQHGRGESLAPPHCPTCARRDEGEVPPLILSPASGQRYIFQENDGHARQRLLLKAASRAGKVYWFIDGALHTAGVPLEPAFWPLERGAHTIVCSDDAGRSSSVAIEVR
jgi:membrane carboxypeptidase/penicillin-binding protein PbpC